MIVANVIFYAFRAAYFSWLFLAPLSVAVLFCEGAILWAFNRSAPVKVIVVCTIGMNVASYAVGYFISPYLLVGSGLVVVAPDEHGSGVVDRGPKWQYFTRMSFLQAGVVSVVVESLVLLFARERMGLKSVICPVLVGNVITYVCLCQGFVGIFGEWPHHTPPPDSRDLDSYSQSFRAGSSLPRSDPFRQFGIGPRV